jgi:hypothetical protein
MRLRVVLAATALLALGLASSMPAEAGGTRRGVADVTDPYAYYVAPRGYYPYYNSGYWRPAAELAWRRRCCRPHFVLPPYHQAWGYPDRVYVHSQ